MIYLLRHGQTDRNLQKRFSGSVDVPINETGMVQAKAQANKLKNIKFDVAFSSPQKRARQTLEIIHKGKIILDDRLREIVCGEFENTPQTTQSFNDFYAAMKNGTRGVEQWDIFTNRVNDFCDMLVEKHNGKSIIICTHAANVQYMNYYFLGKPKDYDFTKSVGKQGEYLLLDNSAISSLQEKLR